MNHAATHTSVLPTHFQRVVLASRPGSRPTTENFRLETVATPVIGEGQVLVRNQFLSIDPYMLGRMYDARSYAPPQALGEVMIGETAGTVVVSRHPDFAVGQRVVGRLGWQEISISDGSDLQVVDDSDIPLTAYLGAVGMTGITAWYGIERICAPEDGETVVVSGAAGAVGSVAVQLA